MRLAARVEGGGQADEPVDHPVVPARLDRDTGITQPLRVGLAFVAERVVLGGDHDRRRHAPQLRRPQRRDAPVRRVGTAARVAVEEPPHRSGLEQVPGPVVPVRARVEVGSR